jgi:hypothetical protein
MLNDMAQARPTFGRTGPNNELDIDIRSRRKITSVNETLILSLVATAVTATPTWFWHSRVLLALP